jgi:hypothetical protein
MAACHGGNLHGQMNKSASENAIQTGHSRACAPEFLRLVVQQSKDGAVGFTLALLVFWSRLYLRRHDLRETLVGAFLGLLGGLVTAW